MMQGRSGGILESSVSGDDQGKCRLTGSRLLRARGLTDSGRDIASANNSAAREVADAQRDAQKDMSADAYNVATAKADGDHKIATQKCVSQTP